MATHALTQTDRQPHSKQHTRRAYLPDEKRVLRARFGVLETKYLNTPAPLHEPVVARMENGARRRPFLIFVSLYLAPQLLFAADGRRSRSNPSFQEFCLGFPVLSVFFFHSFFVYISNTRRARCWWHISCIPLPSRLYFSLSSALS